MERERRGRERERERERENMILHKIFDIVSYVIYKQYVQWIIREKSAVS